MSHQSHAVQSRRWSDRVGRRRNAQADHTIATAVVIPTTGRIQKTDATPATGTGIRVNTAAVNHR